MPVGLRRVWLGAQEFLSVWLSQTAQACADLEVLLRAQNTFCVQVSVPFQLNEQTHEPVYATLDSNKGFPADFLHPQHHKVIK